jgi:RNA polymerase sigma-70 factor (ECF subfamily)
MLRTRDPPIARGVQAPERPDVLPDPDPEVLRRFQEGDASAFEEVVRRFEGPVLSLVRRYLGSRSPGVEDVAQAVFVRIWRARRTYEPRAKLGTWIYRIAVNASLNEIRSLRAEKNRRVASFTAVFGDGRGGGDGRGDGSPGGTRESGAYEGPTAPESLGTTPLDALGGAETAARVRAAVDALPEQQRLALVLSRFHGCSHEDVAAATGSSVPAVKSLLMRARENLRRALAPHVSPSTPRSPGRASASEAARSKGDSPR